MVRRPSVIAAGFVVIAAVGAAHAADASVYDWTGFYAGVYGGLGAVAFSADGNGDFATGTGVLAGGAASYQQQLDNIVFGVDGEIGLTGIADRYDAGVVPDGGNIQLDVLGSLRARLGFAVGQVQIYGTGGVGFGRVSDSFGGAIDAQWMSGWTAGLGAAYAVTDAISVDVQYLHTELGPVTFFGGALRESARADTVTTGINFHF